VTGATMTTVGAVLQRIEAGRSTKTLERPAKDGELGILRVSAVTWGEFRPGENKAMPLDYDPGNVPRPMKGDILISRANTRELVGAPVMVEADHPNLLLSDKILRLVPDCNIVVPRYLLRALRSSIAASHFSQCAGGTSGSMTNITQGDIRATPLRLPSLPEQRRIAAILDKADTLRAKRRDVIAKLNQMLQSVFLEMFGDPVTNPKEWPEKLLSEVVNQGTIVTYGIVQAGKEFPGGTPYIRTGDIAAGEIVEVGLRRTDPVIAKKFSRSRVEAGDIVMSIRATVGTTALVPKSLDGANLTQGTARIAVGEKIARNFALHHLRSAGTQRWIERQVKGATFREITLGRLRELPMMIPPRILQDKFDLICQHVSTSALASQSSLAGLEKLFTSLQQQAFEGKL